MRSIWQEEAAARLLSRTARLDPALQPRWGRLTCTQMIVHVTDALKLYMGELDAAGRWTPLRYAPLKQAFIYVLPIPKNVPTAPELIARPPADWQTECERFRATLDQICGQRTRTEWPSHPIFGRLSTRALGTLAYKHTDHHLRQFGV